MTLGLILLLAAAPAAIALPLTGGGQRSLVDLGSGAPTPGREYFIEELRVEDAVEYFITTVPPRDDRTYFIGTPRDAGRPAASDPRPGQFFLDGPPPGLRPPR